MCCAPARCRPVVIVRGVVARLRPLVQAMRRRSDAQLLAEQKPRVGRRVNVRYESFDLSYQPSRLLPNCYQADPLWARKIPAPEPNPTMGDTVRFAGHACKSAPFGTAFPLESPEPAR